MRRGQTWAAENGDLHIVVSADAITDALGRAITVRLVPNSRLPESSFAAHIGDSVVLATSITNQPVSHLVRHVGEVTGGEMAAVDRALKASLDL